MTLMESHTTDQLHIIVNHLPFDRLIANLNGLTTKSAGTIFNHRKSFGQKIVKTLSILVTLHKLSRFCP